MVVVVDNYDSFTYNIVQYLQMLNIDVTVVKNDQCSVESILALSPTHILISPGPCSPNEAGISMQVISTLAGQLPILGICLGHQCIAQAFGGKVAGAKQIMHGKTSVIDHNESGLFKGLKVPLTVNRYHSLAVAELPPSFNVTATTSDGEIMAIAHEHLPIFGVQFHPESILSEGGLELLANFVACKVSK